MRGEGERSARTALPNRLGSQPLNATYQIAPFAWASRPTGSGEKRTARCRSRRAVLPKR